jgi:GDP-4-dehydro-6-deoxy-D-mannose reductase
MSRSFKRCIVTGATGSGGSYLVEHLIKKDNKIKIYCFYRSKGYLDLLKKKYKKNIHFIKIDLKNYNKLKKFLKNINPDLIFHMASNADVRGSFDDPISITNNNNLITINLLESVKILKINPLIIICSTSEVYGNVKKKDIPISESQKISPINPYAVSKAFQDLISQVYYKSFKLRIIITRMFSYTNARRLNLFQTAFANQIVGIERGKLNVLKHGNLNSIRTFVDIEDAMEAYWLAAKKGKIGQIYNIGGKKIISVKNFLNKLINKSNVRIKCSLDKKLIRPQDLTIQIPNIKNFLKDTGWKPKVPFEDSVKKLLDYCRENYRK